MMNPSTIKQYEQAKARSPFHKASRNLLRKLIMEENKRDIVLEIGVGTADISREIIAPLCKQFIGVDIQTRFHNFPTNGFFVEADALRLPFRDGCFDMVIHVDVIEHIDCDIAFLKENLRILKKGGCLIFVTPNGMSLNHLVRKAVGKGIKFPHCYEEKGFLGDIYHYREYSYTDITHLLRGLKLKRFKIIGHWLGIPQLNFCFWNTPCFFFKKICYSWKVKLYSN